jgi:hypothetical protein
MTRRRILALIAVAIVTAWQLADTIRIGGLAGLAVVVGFMTLGIFIVEVLERRSRRP